MRRARAPTSLAALAAAGGCALGLTGAAWARQAPADEGPIVVGERRGAYRGFELARFGAGLDFFAQHRRDTLKQGGTRIADKETLFRETLDLSAQCYIGHQNLLDISGDAKLGFEDRFLHNDSLRTVAHESDFTDLYDVRATILGAGPAPTTVYSRRDESLLDRAFAGSIKAITTEHGVIVPIRSTVAPTTFQYFHREQNEHDQLGLLNYGQTQDTFQVHSSVNLARGQSLLLDYAHDEISETQAPLFRDDYSRNDASVTHTIDFGSREQHDLRSNFRFYNQSGRFPQQTARLDEQLHLRHTDRFETRYAFLYEDRDTLGRTQRTTRGSVSLRHRLFASLVSTAGVSAQRLEIPGEFTSDEYTAEGALNYTKKVPLGRLDLGLGLAYTAQHNGERGSPVSFLDQSRTFNDPFPITVSQRRVEGGSVVVTDSTGTRTFREGLDYTLVVLADRFEVRRVVGGAIADGQGVLIDYVVAPEPASDIDTTSTNASFRYTLQETRLRGLSPYASYRTLDQSIDSADPSAFVLDHVRDLLYGVEYTRGGVGLKAERQERHSDLNAYDATRLSARYDQGLGPGSSLGVEIAREIIDYTERSERVDFTRATVRWTQQVTPELSTRVLLTYRDEQSDISGDSTGFEQQLEVRWHRRQTSVFAAIRNSMLNGTSADTTSQTFQIGIHRSF